MVWRLLTNVWYSININGVRHGFFKSSRGIKQGGPLSPSLFVIGAELLSKLMDNLIGLGFILYFIENKGPTINHLCYADDIILFSFCHSLSLNMMMDKLRLYEQVSRQLVNKRKSGFYTSAQDDDPRIPKIQRITGFPNCPFPIQYLGCPIYVGRKKIIYSTTRWQGKLCT
ncbi:uncharacterized protein LOC142168830 [Nicotiana tabacum]|uniref:Uncharacterized protein LOC142168830 n=1 Tax=Nicotiana tabacum TaxID=4097 RepID=A0AC58SM91_TOBAC